MYFNVNFGAFFKIIKVLLLVSELYTCNLLLQYININKIHDGKYDKSHICKLSRCWLQIACRLIRSLSSVHVYVSKVTFDSKNSPAVCVSRLRIVLQYTYNIHIHTVNAVTCNRRHVCFVCLNCC